MANPDFVKDPDAVLDYTFDWTRWLASDETISTSTVTVSAGLTKNSDSKTTKMVTAWVSGGASGQPYTITSHIVTNQGRTDERTITIRVTNR